MKIRQAKIEDKDKIMKLVRLLYRASSKAIKRTEKKYSKSYQGFFVMEDKNKIVAYIAFGTKGNSIYIGDLYVLPKYRKKKIGTVLIKLAERVQKKLKKKYLRVDVRKKDKPAIKLYNKLGFKFWKAKGKRSMKLRK